MSSYNFTVWTGLVLIKWRYRNVRAPEYKWKPPAENFFEIILKVVKFILTSLIREMTWGGVVPVTRSPDQPPGSFKWSIMISVAGQCVE